MHVATEPMVELRSSSKIVPAQGIPKKDIATEFRQGEVYLVTDRGERKKTGSYYTPDFIVKYMVDETLRSVLEAVVHDAQTDAERIQAVLALNVLDPSMGSGHFLVEVTEGSGEKENDKAKKSILALRGGGYHARYYACSEVCDDLLKCFYFANKGSQLFQRKMALHRTLESPAKSEEEIFL